ncbi:hypothetical protein F2P81_022795 [Scophthalmus maximus]|uniref:WAPL domain-containing protein n=1 Tax=Scophthalmus maximus TaxID=52904 RepID=A0A6A4S5U0_SCOMX|nr:hypothetical protein F2P81_022795 [Scophthalmus maximus]
MLLLLPLHPLTIKMSPNQFVSIEITREYDPDATMTSRFGKTYSRKGGEGTSKFDEVLSTKRGTLSTKWGDTTYKAKVGSKRAGAAAKNDSVLEVYKRPRPSGDGLEDPFGFDSDEESKPVSSSRSGSKSSPAKPASAEPPRAERPGVSLSAGSRSSLQGPASHTLASARGDSWPPSDRNQPRLVEDTARFFNSSASIGKSQQSSLSLLENQHSYSWYQNASESDKKPLAQTTTLKTGYKAESTTYNTWDAIMGLRPPSPSQEPRNPAPTLSWASAGVTAGDRDPVQTRREKPPPSPPQLQSARESEDLGLDSDFLMETSDFSQTSSSSSTATSSSLVRNSNCRTYRRPNKQGAGKAQDSGAFASSVFGTDLPKSSSDASNKTTAVGGRGRGRTRDYTVLHPSSVSMCNVTIQDRAVEEFSSDAAPSSGSSSAGSGSTTELGEAGWQRKKMEQQNTRSRPTQAKSKKDSKLDLFGFEDADAHQEENSSDNTDNRSTYKIKYFGFDDMSDSDGDDDDDDGFKERRRAAKKAAADAAKAATAVIEEEEEEDEEEEEAPTYDPPDPFERLETRERPAAKENKKHSERHDGRIREDVLDFSEEGLRVVAGPPRRLPAGKAAEKNPDNFRRIFSAHKKAAASAGGSTKEPSDAQKDDGLFKAPPPPPKVTKCVTFPTDLYQDTVTTLKCRKEHKELYTVVQHVKHFNDVVEFGENQEFTDDFEYLATGLKSGQPLNTRCLSVISLATRCAMPSFRMHLRARGKVAQVFKTLNDAPQHPNLALCTASLMYILSRDRLNMDLDRSCLDLMIRLLELDLDQDQEQDQDQDQDQGGCGGAVADTTAQFSAREIAKMKEKIRKLCDTVHNKHLDLQNITVQKRHLLTQNL